MAWSGGGTFSRVHNWVTDAAAAIGITASRVDAEADNFATGINACLTKNNETKPTATFSPNVTRTYDLGATSLRWQSLYLETSIDVQSSTASGATTLAFTDGTSPRTITFPDATGTVPLLESENTFTSTQKWSKGADVASATALTLGADGNYFDITGTTTVTSIGTIGIGTTVKLHFDGAVLLTYHATDLVMPGGVDYTTSAGDEFEFIEYASGDWRCTGYALASGESLSHFEGVAVASATDCDIWASYGDTVHLTGTTTVTDWGTAPRAGATKRVVCDAATPLTHNATTNDLPGAVSITTVAGDSFTVYAVSASAYKIIDYTRYSTTPGNSLSSLVRTEVAGRNSSGALTDITSGITVATVDCGTVVTGDRILVTAFFVYTGGNGTDSVSANVLLSSGTATLAYLDTSGGLYGSSSNAASGNCSVNGIIKVTGSGTCVLKLTGTDAGTNADIAQNFGQIHALVLKGS